MSKELKRLQKAARAALVKRDAAERRYVRALKRFEDEQNKLLNTSAEPTPEAIKKWQRLFWTRKKDRQENSRAPADWLIDNVSRIFASTAYPAATCLGVKMKNRKVVFSDAIGTFIHRSVHQATLEKVANH